MKKFIVIFGIACSFCLLGTSEGSGSGFREFRSPALMTIDSNGRAGGFDSALEAHLNNHNRDSDLIFLLGNQYFKMNKYEKAFKVFSKDSTGKNLFGAATTARLMGDFQVALDYYNRMSGQSGEVHLGKGLAYRGLGQYGRAIEELTIYVNNYSKNENVFLTIAGMYVKQGNYNDAAVILRRAPKSTAVDAMLANVTARLN